MVFADIVVSMFCSVAVDIWPNGPDVVGTAAGVGTVKVPGNLI